MLCSIPASVSMAVFGVEQGGDGVHGGTRESRYISWVYYLDISPGCSTWV